MLKMNPAFFLMLIASAPCCAAVVGESGVRSETEPYRGAYYLIQVPAGGKVSIDIPAMCLNYSRDLPNAESLRSGIDEPEPLVREIIAVHSYMSATVDAWMAVFGKEFDLPRVMAEIGDHSVDSDMVTLVRLEREMDRIKIDIRSATSLQELATMAKPTSEALMRAMEELKRIDSAPNREPEAVRKPDPHMAMSVFLDKAQQWAVWRMDAKFRDRLAKLDKGAAGLSESSRALERVSFVMYEAAKARVGNGEAGSTVTQGGKVDK